MEINKNNDDLDAFFFKALSYFFLILTILSVIGTIYILLV